jgi:trafficking protein particle complex subunit 2
LTDRVFIDMKFVLLHEAKNEEGIRAFFTEVWELYVKVC